MYRPNQRQSCCPHYAIRLDSTQFKPSRSQRHAVNRFNRYVLGDTYSTTAARLYPKSHREAKRRDNEFQLVDRIHEAEYSSLKTPPEPAHRLAVTLEEDSFSEEKYSLYDNYQRVVHNEGPEDRTRRSFRRFLCSSPLRRQMMDCPDGRRRRLGSFHQCYRIDGKLVAVGVLDLLPDCVSSVYFLYHESIHKFAPGKLGALYEISLALEEGYRWWYSGFYIHNCSKMRYKIEYSPQYILDPQSLDWDLLDDDILKTLDEQPFLSLSVERRRLLDGADEGGQGCGHHEEDGARALGTSLTAPAADGAEDEADEKNENEGASLFQSDMPGIPTVGEMDKVDLDHVAIKVFPTGPLFEAADLVNWDAMGIADWPSVKASVAELVAVLGPDLARKICLDLTLREGD